MKDIAEKLGVSVMTVSLALRNSPDVSAETGDRVRKMAKALGYKKDPALSSLIAYRSKLRLPAFAGTLAYINNYDKPNITKDPEQAIHMRLFAGARERAEELGYKLEEFWLRDPGKTPEQMMRILRARNIRGLLLGPQQHAGRDCPITWEHFSAVKFGYSLIKPHLHTVCPDQFLAMKMCVEELSDRGYERIGALFYPAQIARTSGKILGAYLAAIMMLGLESIPPFVGEMMGAEDELFLEWFCQHRPDALICTGGWTYCQSLLRKEGILCPRDYGAIVPHTYVGERGVAHINEHYEILGAKMVEFVVQMIHQDERGIPKNPVDLNHGVSVHPGKTIPRKRKSARKWAPLL